MQLSAGLHVHIVDAVRDGRGCFPQSFRASSACFRNNEIFGARCFDRSRSVRPGITSPSQAAHRVDISIIIPCSIPWPSFLSLVEIRQASVQSCGFGAIPSYVESSTALSKSIRILGSAVYTGQSCDWGRSSTDGETTLAKARWLPAWRNCRSIYTSVPIHQINLGEAANTKLDACWRFFLPSGAMGSRASIVTHTIQGYCGRAANWSTSMNAVATSGSRDRCHILGWSTFVNP